MEKPRIFPTALLTLAQQNNVGDEGVIAIADAMRVNQALDTLDICVTI